ncbi:hypothetical protein AC579_9844 [Pseudocercospora musae]|uniref:Myb-like domain-containing protein n=1 Tax=Pseudocercospora musae TaxID=113226 RepID=A0A139IV46_9PEZI|nr:hypothetical protein AC579_9844 [Pseudocercospora musae]
MRSPRSPVASSSISLLLASRVRGRRLPCRSLESSSPLPLSFPPRSVKTSTFTPICNAFAPFLPPGSFCKDSLRRRCHGSDTPASNRQPWRREDIDVLLSLQKQGKSQREMAATLQRSPAAVASRLATIRLTGDTTPGRPQRDWTEQEINHLKSVMHGVVKTPDIKAICASYGRSWSSIKGKLKALRREAGLSKGHGPSHLKVWTQQEFNLAKALYEEGKNCGEIGRVLDRSKGSVRQRLRHEQLSGEPFKPHRYISNRDSDQIRLLRAQGKSLREIYQLMSTRPRISVASMRRIAHEPETQRTSPWSSSDMVEKGTSLVEIVEHLPGRSKTACRVAIERWVGPLQRGAWSESEIAQLLQLRKEGKNIQEISAQLGRSPGACYGAFSRHNKRKPL